jgi:hypothetical protein
MFLVIKCTTAEGLVSEGASIATVEGFTLLLCRQPSAKDEASYVKIDENINGSGKLLVFRKWQTSGLINSAAVGEPDGGLLF